MITSAYNFMFGGVSDDSEDKIAPGPETPTETTFLVPPVVDDDDDDEEMWYNSHERESDKESVALGPWTDFLLQDSFIVLFVAMSLSVYPTVKAWGYVSGNQIPFSVVLSWLLVAYATGQLFSIKRWKPMGGNRWDNEMEQDRIRQQSHRILNALLACVRSSPVRFKSLTKPIKGVSRRQSYTYLNMPSVARKPWQQHCDPTKDLTNSNSSLMNNLLRNQKLPHVRRSSLIAQDGVAKSAPPVDMGTFDMPQPASLNDFVVNPLFRLRGMDVFTANGGDPEANIADHPWLIQNGLRDKPTFVVNAIVQWGNIVLYFEMPEWVRDWDSIMEKDNDPDDVKALKRFLKGTDEYRNERFKVVPSVVAAPFAVRLIAPPKRERTIQSSYFTLSWSKHDGATVGGRTLCAAIQCEIDCISNRAIRGMAGIATKHLRSIKVDAAITVGKPEGQEEDEPEACLGMLRLDHIDISSCPKLPDRFEFEAKAKGQAPDVLRASQIMHLSPADIESLAQMA